MEISTKIIWSQKEIDVFRDYLTQEEKNPLVITLKDK